MSTLCRAAQKGDLELVRRLVEVGRDPYGEDDDGLTALHAAAEHGRASVLRELIRLGAAADARSHDGVRPLHLACRHNHIDVVKALLAEGASVSGPDDVGFTPLHSAADGGAARITLLLLRSGAAADVRAKGGATPLHTAAENGHAGATSVLLKWGAEPNACRDDGSTPLHYAARGGHVSVIKRLLRGGANANARDLSGATPLDLALLNSHPEAAELLLAAGAGVGTGFKPHPAARNSDAPVGATTLAPGEVVPGTRYRLMARLGVETGTELWSADPQGGGAALVLRFCVDAAAAAEFRARIGRSVESVRGCADPEGLAAPVAAGLEAGRDVPFVGLAPIRGELLDRFLERRFANEGPYSAAEAARFLRPLAELVARLHALPPVPERPDLRPASIAVTGDVTPLFQVDGFGTRCPSTADRGPTELATLAESVGYASHEQTVSGHVRGPSDDVHALGVLLCALLFGEIAPFGLSPPGRSRFFDWGGFRERLRECGLGPEASALLESCLRPHDVRPKDAGELAVALRRLYPTLRERVEADAAQVGSARRGGADWEAVLTEKLPTRRPIWERAAGENIAAAQWLLGLVAERDPTLEPGPAGAARRFAAAADQRFAAAEYDLALYHLYGLGGAPRDPEAAVRLLRRSADRGHCQAQLQLGICLRDGVGGPADRAAAARRLRAAAGAGLTQASYELGRLLLDAPKDCLPAFDAGSGPLARYGYRSDEQKLAALRRLGRDLIGRAAQAGHAAACFDHALELSTAIRDPQNVALAEGLLAAAAEAGRVDACRELAVLRLRRWRESGITGGRHPDAESAVLLLRAAADFGDAEAAYRLGSSYFAGLALPGVDESEAVAGLEAATASGHDGAGVLLERHAPVPQPPALARLVSAAAAGVCSAQARLARHRERLGDRPLRLEGGATVEERERHYREAAAAGDPAATRCLLRLLRSRGGRLASDRAPAASV